MKNIGLPSVTGVITWEAKVQNQKVGSRHGGNFLQVDFYAVCFKPENVFCLFSSDTISYCQAF